MRKALIVLTCMAAIGLHAPSASALTLTFDDSLSVGWVDPCAFRVAIAAVGCTGNSVITVPPSDRNTVAGALSASTTTGTLVGRTEANTHGTVGNVNGFADLMAQYDAASDVWLSSGFTGSTHQSLLGADTVAVPDGGATAALLGLALVAIRFAIT